MPSFFGDVHVGIWKGIRDRRLIERGACTPSTRIGSESDRIGIGVLRARPRHHNAPWTFVGAKVMLPSLVALGLGWSSPASTPAQNCAQRSAERLQFRTMRPRCASLAPIEAYEQLLVTAPLLTKALTQGFIWGTGDMVAQMSTAGARSISAQRTANFFVTGIGSGVLWSSYYDASDMLISPLPGGAIAHTALAITLETVVWCPLVFSLYQIPISVLQNGGAPADVPAAVRRQLGDMLVANVKVWTPANVIIYNVPLQWRVLCSNAVDLVWGYVCSNFAADACAPDDDECLIDAAEEFAAPALGSRRPTLARRGLPRLVRSRARAWWRERR